MKTILALACGAMLGIAVLTGSATADVTDRNATAPKAASIVGTWQVEVTVRANATDCTTSPPVGFGPNPFPALHTFHVGGTMSETGSRSAPSNRSPGHGVWKRTGVRDFESRHTFQGFDANGLLSTNMDIRSEITLSSDGETFTGVSRLAFSDISGNTVPFCATLEGARFTL